MNLATRYLGMTLRTPLVPSASPLSDNLDNVKRMEDAGAAAVVFHSLFEEHILEREPATKSPSDPWHRELCGSTNLLSGFRRSDSWAGDLSE